jgi:hypothetical protein
VRGACLLARPQRHFDSFADLPFVNVGNSKVVIEEITADERDLGLLRLMKEGRSISFLTVPASVMMPGVFVTEFS